MPSKDFLLILPALLLNNALFGLAISRLGVKSFVFPHKVIPWTLPI